MKGINNVLVHVPSDEKFIDERNGLAINTSFNPQDHVKGVGIVLGIPNQLTGIENGKIVPEVQVGDEIIFHYSVIDDGNNQENENYMGNFDGKEVYKVDYFNVFCRRAAPRDPWQMIGGWVLCDEHFEEKVEVYEYTDPLSKARVRVPVTYTKSGLVAQANVKRSTRIAKLINIGTPLRGAPVLDIKPGDLVLFRDGIDGEVEIDGKRYILMLQEELFAKVD